MKQSGRTAGKANPVVNFPIWSRDQQSLLSKILSSILFTDIEEENKAYLKSSTLFSEQGITVKYTGYQLNQKDFDVWMFLVRGARKTSGGYECNLNTSNVLELGKESHLESCIEHLIAGIVEVKNSKYTYCSGLVSSFYEDKVTKDQQITLNSDFAKLFKEYELDSDKITS
jgi:hypothetical protein